MGQSNSNNFKKERTVTTVLDFSTYLMIHNFKEDEEEKKKRRRRGGKEEKKRRKRRREE